MPPESSLRARKAEELHSLNRSRTSCINSVSFTACARKCTIQPNHASTAEIRTIGGKLLASGLLGFNDPPGKHDGGMCAHRTATVTGTNEQAQFRRRCAPPPPAGLLGFGNARWGGRRPRPEERGGGGGARRTVVGVGVAGAPGVDVVAGLHLRPLHTVRQQPHRRRRPLPGPQALTPPGSCRRRAELCSWRLASSSSVLAWGVQCSVALRCHPHHVARRRSEERGRRDGRE